MKVLAIRFSAMGDVALLAAAAKAWLYNNPSGELIVCSRPIFQPLFEPLERCTFYGADVKKTYKGLLGMKMLADLLVNEFDFDHVADLHDVIRSRMLSTFLRFKGYPISRIKKGRAEKKKLTSRTKKQLLPLTHTVQRYLNALPGQVQWRDEFLPIFQNRNINTPSNQETTIGIAPFAKHPTKQWPENRIVELIHKLTHQGIRCLIFGTPEERKHLLRHFSQNTLVESVPDTFSLKDEIKLIGQLRAFIAMDSFNMHLAALCGVPVVSIWGPTHPYAGFSPLGSSQQHMVQIDLECRPCSIYGNKPCYRDDHACMQGISVERVYKEVLGVL
ncbi:heptosyltransferase [Thermaurantimonas aggregans]|uniref:Heptosyltransferase n=1 Tax=Thermaurantimonas aggregans TaxID=2173829 RepID=A0A401XNM6_9FLAO|nr:glycosyltransferase family 9 protein [Thermaurantimonas aggregans]MCX8148031.1 glycosyltransferase family 9 protein [Thermaurantimonas aggregans]GCD78605.1 heptosyltransferase [Thermaurantimonas aggregans]